MHLCLFEDASSNTLLPLTYFRPVYDLRCGMFSLRERIVRILRPARISLLVRGYLAGLLREENPHVEINDVSSDACLFVNGRVIMTSELGRRLQKMKEDAIIVAQGEIVAIRLSGENLRKSRSSTYEDAIDLSNITGIETTDVTASLVRYPWDLIYAAESVMATDYSLLAGKSNGIHRSAAIHKSASLLQKKNIHIGKRSIIGAGSVLDASNGPIYIGDGAKVLHLAMIEGPCFIGDSSIVKAGAKIYGGTSIGAHCKVGGEVEHTVLHSHANKQHDGFLGHSYIAPWVNLGAGTTTSNLKNTYGSIRVMINGTLVDSGKIFVGLTAGDHVKVGINGTIDTGTVIGPSSNLYGTALPPKTVPPFSWGSGRDLSTYEVEKALAVAVTVMGRRNVIVTETYKNVFRHVFEMTANERTNR